MDHKEFSRKGGRSRSKKKLKALKESRIKAVKAIRKKYRDIRRCKSTPKRTQKSQENGKLGGRPKKQSKTVVVENV